jgi:hypothetical protein
MPAALWVPESRCWQGTQRCSCPAGPRMIPPMRNSPWICFYLPRSASMRPHSLEIHALMSLAEQRRHLLLTISGSTIACEASQSNPARKPRGGSVISTRRFSAASFPVVRHSHRRRGPQEHPRAILPCAQHAFCTCAGCMAGINQGGHSTHPGGSHRCAPPIAGTGADLRLFGKRSISRSGQASAMACSLPKAAPTGLPYAPWHSDGSVLSVVGG